MGKPDEARRPSRAKVSRAPVLVLIFGFALALGLVLLGADMAAQPAPAPSISRPGTADEPRTVNVILRDYAFNPTPLRLVGGEKVRFQIVNGGLVEHEFVIGDATVQQAWASAHAGATPPAPFATRPPASVPPTTGGLRVVLRSGEQAVVDYDVPASHAPQLFCHLPGHVEQGMIGEVVLISR